MTQDLEKAKIALQKTFCFTEMQANEAKAGGQALLEAEDIKFLLSLPGIRQEEIASFQTGDTYDSKDLFLAIEKAKADGFKGFRLDIAVLTREDEARVHAMGYILNPTGYCSVLWDEIYFSVEAYIESHVSDFQNFIGNLRSSAHLL